MSPSAPFTEIDRRSLPGAPKKIDRELNVSNSLASARYSDRISRMSSRAFTLAEYGSKRKGINCRIDAMRGAL
ncbi:MAG: hypothetical protein ACYCPR_00905 [Thermoplasmataceae archaeon]